MMSSDSNVNEKLANDQGTIEGNDQPPEWEFQGVRLEMTAVPHYEQTSFQATPSVADGLTNDDEYGLRIFGCEMIQTSGQLLKLPQVAMATAQILYQRFYNTKSFVRHSYEHYAMACIHLAAKIEECPRRIRDTINVFHHMRQAREQKQFTPLIPDQAYVNLKNHVVKAERRVLKELGFCVHVKHPHKLIVCYLRFLGEEKNQHFVQCAWNLMNDSLRTNVFVRFYPVTIACACIYLAARQLGIRLPEKPGESVNWWEVFRQSESSIREICLEILYLYSLPKPNVKSIEQRIHELVEKRRIELEKKQSQREAAAAASAAAPSTPSASTTTNAHQPAFSVVPGGLLMRNLPPASPSSEDCPKTSKHRNRRSRSVEKRSAGGGRHTSSIEGRSNGRSSTRHSSDKHRKHHTKHSRHKRSRSRSRSRTPKAYRRHEVNSPRSRSPIRRVGKSTKSSGVRRDHKPGVRRKHQSISRSPSLDYHRHRSSTNMRNQRETKNNDVPPHRRHHRRRRSRSSSTSSSSTSSSSSSGDRRMRKSGKRVSALSTITANGRKKVHRDKDKH